MIHKTIAISMGLALFLGALTYIPSAFANPCQSGAFTGNAGNGGTGGSGVPVGGTGGAGGSSGAGQQRRRRQL